MSLSFQLFVVFFVVAQENPEPVRRHWTDIKRGDCLTIREIQEIGQVLMPSLMEPGNCGTQFETEGDVMATAACGVEYFMGSWSREMVEHRKPGVFWPRRVPCMASVKNFETFQTFYQFLTEPNSCTVEELSALYRQTEKFEGKMYEAGQGEIYLPHPLTITREFLNVDDATPVFCEQTQINLEYTGWGNLSGTVDVRECGSDVPSFCMSARLSAEDTDEGGICLEFKRIDDCDRE